ncbi:MAG: hypothetical protein N2Z72_00920 [Bacteroidales bacterium]|nr:hypothetical protein [Bacteroidales bacterium]
MELRVRVLTFPLTSTTKPVVSVVPAPTPSKRTLPLTCNLAVGDDVPIPTLPTPLTRARSALFVLMTKSTLSVVPIKFIYGLVDEFPIKRHALGSVSV